jgi:hypothetical protein
MDAPLELSLEQKNKVLEYLNNNKKFNLKKLVEYVGGEDCDYRSALGRLIRKYLEAEGLQEKIDRREKNAAETAAIKKEIPPELTDAQKEFIDNNADSMKFVEMAQVLWDDPKITGLSAEVKLVVEYVKNKETAKLYDDPENIPVDDYSPPKSPLTVIQKINKYVHNNPFSGVTTMNVKKFIEELNPKLKNYLDALIGYLHNFQFLHQINSYPTIGERELFENSYVGYLYDKPNLTSEELGQYIDLCAETVNMSNLQNHVNKLQYLIDRAADEEDPKLRMSLVDGLNNAREERHKIATRKKQLLDSLTVKRKDKLANQRQNAQSLVELVEYWKDSEKRELLLKAADQRKEELKKESKRLMELDDIICEVYGFDSSELINS